MRLVAIYLAALVPSLAFANDSTAVLGVGGLDLTRSEEIAMVSENLRLSPSEVQVRYAFRNESSGEYHHHSRVFRFQTSRLESAPSR